jgi:hypothetical protein
MARKINVGSLAALAVTVAVLVAIAGSYLVSSKMNRDAETVGNSASAPNSPGGINEQSSPTLTSPRRTEPLIDSNVPPAGKARQ